MNKKFYHGSIKNIKNETILSNDNIEEKYTDSINVKSIEELFEKYKPKDKISRKTAIFLADNIYDIDNLGGYTDFIYEVETTDIVEKSDLSWYTKVSILLDEEPIKNKKIKQYINNYWNGSPSENPCYEYRCKKVKIINEIDNLNIIKKKKLKP